jgi:hypothetical protein
MVTTLTSNPPTSRAPAGGAAWAAQPRQDRFLTTFGDVHEAGYGGAAGGGKTDSLLIWQMLRRTTYPKSRGLFLRRRFVDLSQPGAALDRFRELFGRHGVDYNANEHLASWPNGSETKFAYMESDADRYQYQGAQYDDVTWDEVTQFSWRQYSYMFSRTRVVNAELAAMGLKPRIRSAGNPGGIGHRWFRDRFVDRCWDEPFIDPETGLDRVFVPAKVDDNLALMKSDPLYKASLMNLPDEERRALLDGDWDLFSGQVFGEWRRDVHVCEPLNPPPHWRRWVGFDWGYAAPWVALFAAEEPDTRQLVVYRELTGSKHHDSEIASRLVEAARGEDILAMYCDPSIWTKKNGVSTADIFSATPGWKAHLEPADNDRVAGWRRVHEYLGWKPDAYGGEAISPLLKVGANCPYLIRSLPALVHDENNVEDVDSDGDDHAADALRYLLAKRGARTFGSQRYGSVVLFSR